jgi:hypothetical protein
MNFTLIMKLKQVLVDASLRLWLNCGTVNVTVGSAGTPANMTYNITPANNTFSNTCPLLVHYEPDNRIVPATCAAIVAGVYVAKPPVTNFAAVNLQNSTASHPLQNCRLYYSQIQMDPQHAITYNNIICFWPCFLAMLLTVSEGFLGWVFFLGL